MEGDYTLQTGRRRASSVLMVAGLVVMAGGLLAPAAFGSDEGTVEGFTVSGTRSFDGDSTTFTFELGGSEDPQQVKLVSCPEGLPYASASGPAGEQPQPGEGNIKHEGARFQKPDLGTYTITYDSEVSGAQIVVSPGGNRHRHYNVGTGCSGGTPASTSSSSSSTSSTSITSSTSSTSTSTTSTSTTTTTEPPTTTTTEPPTTTTTEPPATGSEPSTTTTTEGTGGTGEPATTTSSSATTTSSSSTTTTTEGTGAPGSTTTTTDPDVGGAVEEPTSTTTAPPGSETTGTTGEVEGGTAGETGGQGVVADPDSPEAVVGGVAVENLPRTGPDVSGDLVLAGLALFLGGVAVRFGEPEQGSAGRRAA